MILYRASMWSDEIEAREYARVTPLYAVLANGRREALNSSTHALRETPEAAWVWKHDLLLREIASLRQRLARAESQLAAWETKQP